MSESTSSVIRAADFETFMRVDPVVMRLLIYIAIVGTLALLVALVDLWVDLRTIRPRRKWQIKEQAVDFGIALAERTKGPSDLKLRNAVDFAADYCGHHRVKTARNELAKLVEIRLPKKATVVSSP